MLREDNDVLLAFYFLKEKFVQIHSNSIIKDGRLACTPNLARMEENTFFDEPYSGYNLQD